MSVAAIILAGGRAARLGGADKAGVIVDGRPLVDHVLHAVHGCSPVVVVGPDSLARPGVQVVREEPPLAGPAAATVAALPIVGSAEDTWLLACDLPRASELVARLSASEIPPGFDGVIAVDDSGRQQWLAGRYRVSALRGAATQLSDPNGASLRSLVGALRLESVPAGDTAVDLDTWDAINDYRTRAQRSQP